MAKDFNIFLHRHLTECDILIQSIPFRDGISVTDRMIIDAIMSGCRLIRLASAQSDMDIIAQCDRIIKTCREKLSVATQMGVSAEFKEIGVTKPLTDPIELSAENLGTLSTLLNHTEAGMMMAVEPLGTKIAKSLGVLSNQTFVDSAVTGTKKKGFLTLQSDMIPNSSVAQDLKTGLLHIDQKAVIDVSLASLCSRFNFKAVAGIEMVAVLLGARLHHSLGRGYIGVSIGSNVSGTKAKKIEAANTIIELMVEMENILTMFMYPETDSMIVDVDVAESQVKRCRMFSDIDHMSLDDLNDMTLGVLDYVILAG